MMLTSGLKAHTVRAHLKIYILHTTHTSHKVKLINPSQGFSYYFSTGPQHFEEKTKGCII